MPTAKTITPEQQIKEVEITGNFVKIITVAGNEVFLPISHIPVEAIWDPSAFYLETTEYCCQGHQTYKVISLKTDKRKLEALMRVIEKLISRHHQGLVALDDPSFKLFELARRIYFTETEKQFQAVLADLKDFNE